MEELELERQLTIELEKHSENALKAIDDVIASLPEKAVQLNFEIFPAQDGDGFFSIRAKLDGPDLYILNKAIDSVANIFSPKYVEDKIEPYIPTVDPFEIDYEANNIVVDCSARWLSKLWTQLNSANIQIPVLIVGHDGYGTITPVRLK